MKTTKILSIAAAAAIAASALAIPTSAEGTYHAYLGVQSASYTFRNAWNEPSYGQGVVGDDGMVYFDQLTGWEGSTALNKGGDFTDVEITGDGTYTVGVTNFDFGSDESLNLLFVSTDIPIDSGITISDVKIKMDGSTKYTFDEAFLSPDETTYLQPMAINIWNDDLGGSDGLFGYIMPTDSIEIEFTVSGMGDAVASTDTASDDAAPAADTTATTSATTGNTAVAAIASVMAVAGVAAVISKKRK
ncbi:MAG: hypothetical protein LUI05_08625 [Oscillospiraceae bacterium]|nr:hypothetical protein [Oscillospiraceae bacterium]